MRDRDTFWFTFIVILALIALWINLPIEHPQWLNNFLLWQSEESKNYNRTTNTDPARIRQGLDLQGGIQVLMQALPVESEAQSEAEAQAMLAASLETARNIIERRVNSLGVSEALVQIQGNDRIVVELPGIDDPDLAVSTIKETGLLEFVDTGATPLPAGTPIRTTFNQATSTPVLTDSQTISPTQGPIYETVFTGRDLKQAFPARNQTTGEYYVALEFQPKPRRHWPNIPRKTSVSS